jgi:protease IV
MKTDINRLFAWFMLGLSLAGLIFFAYFAFLTVNSDFSFSSESVAIIPIEGEIFDARNTLKSLNKYFEEPSVKAVVLKINSPGGAVVPSQAIYEMVMDLKYEYNKPVVAVFSDLGASGGYYIACAADEILAYPSTITGSIGVMAEFYNIENLAGKVGVSVEVMKSGEYKATGHWMKTMTDKEREYLQGVIDDTYDQFLEAVVENRASVIISMAVESSGEGESSSDPGAAFTLEQKKTIVRGLADGRIYTGRQAVENGLIDGLGDIRSAIDRASELANIEDPTIVVAKQPRKAGFLGSMENLFDKIPISNSGHRLRLKYIIPY